ncbi:MAG: glycosyltransferase [Acidobacteriota bacterium]|nr:glycosyltransferase [Acidobacteriota bacterium]
MRIVIVVHTFFPNWRAGTEIYAKSVARKVIEQGHEAFVVCYEPPAEDSSFDGIRVWDDDWEGLPVHRISFSKGHRFFGVKDYFHQEVEDLLFSWFSQIQPDVVHVVHAMHLTTASIWAARRLGLPVVSTTTDFWYVCPTYQLVQWDESLCQGPQPLTCLACVTGGEAGASLRRLAAHKGLSRVLSPILTGLASAGLLRKNWAPSLLWVSERRSWMKQTLAQVDVLLAPAPNTARLITLNGLKPVEMRTSGFGLEKHLSRAAEVHTRDSVLRVGYIGTLRQSKGLHVLIDAMSRLPRGAARLDIYGSPGPFPEYERTVLRLAESMENVRFLGTFPNEKLPEVFAGFDVLAIPALWYENSPLVLLSAFALKTPVVASNVGSLADFVEHGKSGLLFEMGNADDLARQLRKLVDEPEQLERLRSGIPEVRTIDDNIGELIQIYTKLMRDSAGRRPFAGRPPTLPRGAMRWGALRSFLKARAFGAKFEGDLTLIRFEAEARPNRELCFHFQWHARDVSPEWVVFIHLVDENGDTQIQGDHRLCLHDQDPWGFIEYRLSIFTEVRHCGKSYRIRLGVWSPASGRRLPVLSGRGMQVKTADWVSPGGIQMA